MAAARGWRAAGHMGMTTRSKWRRWSSSDNEEEEEDGSRSSSSSESFEDSESYDVGLDEEKEEYARSASRA